MYNRFTSIFVPVFENTPPTPPPTPTTPPPTEDKKFTQEDLNRLLAEERRKAQTQTQKALEELEALKNKTTLTNEEKAELERRVEDLSNSLLTKEELAKKEKEKLEKQSKQQIEALTTELGTWKNRYNDSTIRRAITDAAVETSAFSPAQIVAILGPQTRLAEELGDDGKPNGELIPKVKFTDVGKDGKPVTLDLTVLEAVKRMAEKDDYKNLFRVDGTGGVGGTSGRRQTPSGKIDPAELARTDPARYRKLRKEGKIEL